VGVPFEERLTERVHEFSEGIIITNVAEGLGLRHFDSENHEHEHGLADPHVWLDPLRMYSIVENITSSLTAQDPGGREYYRAHADSLLTLLHALDTEIKGVLSPYAGRSVFVYHPSFGYFTDRYKLKQIAIEREGKEASARQLTDLIAQARKDSVHTLFSQPQFPRRQAEVVAREIGASVTVVDPLSGDYLSMMRDLAMRIAQTFSHSAVSQ